MKAYLIGGDSRERYLAYRLEKKGMEIVYPEQGNSLKDKKVEMILLPTPVTTDDSFIKMREGQKQISLKEIVEIADEGMLIFGGLFPQKFQEALEKKKAIVYDFMKMEDIAIQNAVATAEGAIAEAVFLSNSVLHGQEVLVVGYGRCGEVLADKLKGMSAKVTILARREEVRAKAWSFGNKVMEFTNLKDLDTFRYIFNTVPAFLIQQEWIDQLSHECCIIDIASKPGGTDFDYCSQKGIMAKLCSSLPGKYAPKTSGELLAEKVIDICRLL